MTHHLVGITEIAEMLGVSRQRVGQIVAAYSDFPEPEAEIAAGRVWSRTGVERWISEHAERRPGRPDAGVGGEQPPSPFGRFTEGARAVIVRAQEHARLLNHNYIGQEHLVLGLVAQGGIASGVLSWFGVTIERLREAIGALIGVGRTKAEGNLPFTPRAKRVVEIAVLEADNLGHRLVGPEHLLLGIVCEAEGMGFRILEHLGLTRHLTRLATMEALASRPEPLRLAAEPALPVPPETFNVMQYVRNLTGLVWHLPDRVHGRDEEIDRVIAALVNGRCPVLVGEPGLSKTAVVRGVTQRLRWGEAPDGLAGASVVTIDIPAIADGSATWEEFAERLRTVLSRVTELGAIVYLEFLHAWLAGLPAGGRPETTAVLGPLVAEGALRIVGGVASEAELRTYLTGDEEIAGRLEAIEVGTAEPVRPVASPQDALRPILESLQSGLERLEARLGAIESRLTPGS